MPDLGKKVKSSEVETYKKQGYKFKGPAENGREVYEQTTNIPPARGGSKDANPEQYKQFLIQQLQKGVSPEELVKKKYATSLESLNDIKGNYKANLIYTEPEPTAVTPIPLQRGLVADRKIIPGSTDYTTYDYPDANAGYSKATRRYFVENKEIDPTKSYSSTGEFKPSYLNTESLNSGQNLGTTKLNVPTTSSSPLLLDETVDTGKKVRAGTTQGGYGTGNIGFKKGGLVGKVKCYSEGGGVSNGVAGREMGGGDSEGGDSSAASGIVNTAAPMIMDLTNSIISSTNGNDVKALNARANAGMQDPNANLLKNQFSNAYNNAYTSKMNSYGYKKGGLVKKLASGGTVDAIGAAAPLVGDLGSTIIDSQSQDQYGRYDTGTKGGDYAAGISSNALQGAGKGAAAGAALGPEGMAIGAGAGLLVGGIKGGLATKASRESIKQQRTAEDQAKWQVELDRNKIKQDTQLNNQLSTRKTGYGYAKGGLVDKVAMGNNTQSNTPVMNGGYGTFNEVQTDETPMYYQTRTGYNQPMSQWEDRPQYKEKGLGFGGGGGLSLPTPMFNKGGLIKGKGTGTSDSIKAKVEPGSFIVPAKNADKAEKIDKMMDMKERYEEGGKVKRMVPKNKVATLNEKGGENVKLSDGEWKFTPEQKNEIIEELGEDVLKMLAPEANDSDDKSKGGLTSMKAKEILSDGTIHGKAISDKQKRYFGFVAGGGKSHMYKGGEVAGYDKGGKVKSTGKSDPFAGTGVEKIDAENAKKNVVPTKRMPPKRNKLTPEQQSMADDLKTMKPVLNSSAKGNVVPEHTTTENAIQPTYNSNSATLDNTSYKPSSSTSGGLAKGKGYNINSSDIYNVAGGLSSLINSNRAGKFAKQQIEMGNQFLNNAGPRPKDAISPEFQSVLNNANQEAKYGFSPQENAVLENQRLQALNDQRASARFNGLGYSGEREAINNSFGRGLQLQVANKERQMQKQAMANDLSLDKVNLSRRLFEDKLNGWNADQSAGAGLVASGLKNKFDINRYNNALFQLQMNKASDNGNLNFGQ